MNEKDLHRHAAAMRTAINDTLRAVRNDGTCRLCRAGVGQQHDRCCPAWPLIDARAAYAADADPDLFDEREEDDGGLPLMIIP
jgi:hypothetical protein